MLRCPNCNMELKGGSVACPYCGNRTTRSDSGEAAWNSKITQKNKNGWITKEVNEVIEKYLPSDPSAGDKRPANPSDEIHTWGSHLFEELLDKAVEVLTDCGAGSGFFLPNGMIGTNAHVILNNDMSAPANVVVIEHKSKRYPARIVRYSADQDVAIIDFVREKPSNISELANALGDSHALKPGDEVISIGNSRGWGLSYNRFSIKDRVKRHPHFKEHREVILMNGTAQHGNSGGPLYNVRGEVVGLLTGSPTGVETVGVEVMPGVAQAVNVVAPETGVCFGVTIETLKMLL